MPVRLIIEGNSVYEIDEECMERQKMRKNARGAAEAGAAAMRCRKTGSGTKVRER